MVRIRRLVEVCRMAGRTVRRRPFKSPRMAIDTICRRMRTRQGEIRRIVIEIVLRIARRVAGQTGRTVIRVATHTSMFLVRLRVRMAGHTGELRIIIGVGMAVHTGIPFPLMHPAIDREVLAIVIKSSWLPGILGMAARTIRRELQGSMRWIRRLVVIFRMAAHTGRRGIIVVSVMTSGAVIRYSCMRSFQYIIIIVIRESRRAPVRIRRMAARTICR